MIGSIDGYPRFSRKEMERRRSETQAVMDHAGVGHLVVHGAHRHGPAVQWLTGWPTTTESLLVMGTDRTDVLFVQLRNHVPNARSMTSNLEVRWGGDATTAAAIEELRARGARQRIGVMGAPSHRVHHALVETFGDVVDLDPAYTRMRLGKSDEEIEWIRVGVELTDRAIDALLEDARVGMDGHELTDLVERAYVPAGGATHIHFFAVTSMGSPDQCVPAQWPSGRSLRRGDAVTTEISASYWGYPGQILRTFAVESEPTPLYRDLHRVAESALTEILAVLRPGAHPSEVLDAAAVIDDAGFAVYDDLLHGFVGGYLPPILSGRSRRVPDAADLTFVEGMTVVVQPNVITRDERAGVQVGELVRITSSGVERFHRTERGFLGLGR